MNNFGELKKIPLRKIWSREANDFTPCLASNLGDALGLELELTDLELELTDKEASVGEFSLDLLAKDLESLRNVIINVIIENQITQTDHDRLGKLLTYAAGFDVSTVIWVSEEIRDEHRQALERLNQNTDEIQFFAVMVKVLKIDGSKPAVIFKPVVFPKETYKSYFRVLIDKLRDDHNFTETRSRAGHPRRHYFSSDFPGIDYEVRFVQEGEQKDKVRTGLCFKKTQEAKILALKKQGKEITDKFDDELKWEHSDKAKRLRIAVYRDGTIESPDLKKIRKWQIENLLKIKEVFMPEIEQICKRSFKQL